MLNFSIGEKVSFQPAGYPALTPTITRYNKKTVTVVTDGGQQWNVGPSLLRKIMTREASAGGPERIVDNAATPALPES